MGIKGQKINPIGWRVGFYRKWKTAWFQDSWNYGLMLHKTLKIQKIVESFLLYKKFVALSSNIYCLNDNSDNFYIFIFFYNLRLNKKKKQKNNIKFFNDYSIKKNIKVNNKSKNGRVTNFWKMTLNRNFQNKSKTGLNKISNVNFIKNNIRNKYPIWLLNYKQQFKKRKNKKSNTLINKKVVLSHCFSHDWNYKQFMNYSLKNYFINFDILKIKHSLNLKIIKHNLLLLLTLCPNMKLKWILVFLYEINNFNLRYYNQLNLYNFFIKNYFILNNLLNLTVLLEWQNISLFKNFNDFYFTNNLNINNSLSNSYLSKNSLKPSDIMNYSKFNNKSLSKLLKLNNSNQNQMNLDLYINKKYVTRRKKISFKLKKKIRSVFIKPFFIYWGRRVKYFLKNLEQLFGKNSKLFYSRLWKRLYFYIFKESGKNQFILNKQSNKRRARWYFYKHIRSIFFLSHKLLKIKEKKSLSDIIKKKRLIIQILMRFHY